MDIVLNIAIWIALFHFVPMFAMAYLGVVVIYRLFFME